MSQTFRAIVVGAGSISNAWFKPLAEEPVKVVAVVDLNLQAAKDQIAKYELDAIASDDLDQTLAEIDADFVIDLTIPEAHCMVCCKAMEAGFHVVSEKPMAASMDEARKMVATSEKTVGALVSSLLGRARSPSLACIACIVKCPDPASA